MFKNLVCAEAAIWLWLRQEFQKEIDTDILSSCMATIIFHNPDGTQILDYVCKHLSQYKNFETWMLESYDEEYSPGYTLIHDAAYFNDCSTCLYPLLRYIKDKDPFTESGRSLLSVAICTANDKYEHFDSVKIILQANPTVDVNNFKDNQDKHVSYACIYSQKFHNFNTFISLGMDLSYIKKVDWKFLKQKLNNKKMIKKNFKKNLDQFEDILSHIKHNYFGVIEQSTQLAKDVVIHELLPFLMDECIIKDVLTHKGNKL
jgi:hypothetical protein